jgi:predicted lactoylglutathione lyase
MATKIFVNLPVTDLPRSIDFFTSLGYSFNQQFTDETATCMIVGEGIFVMLLTHEKFKGFTPNPICDARASTEVLIALSCDSRAQVDDTVRKAVAAGGNTYNQPQDHDFMYAHGFQDLDGHIWEVLWMDPAAIAPT